MARGSLAAPAVVELLRPFVVTSAHSGKDDLADLAPDVRAIFTGSALSKDPNRLNMFMFVLDPKGSVVHEFHGVPGARRSADPGRSDYPIELKKAYVKLNLPQPATQEPGGRLNSLPDLPAGNSGLPAGVRLLIRQDEPGNSVFSKLPVVEVVKMQAADWNPLAFPATETEIDAAVLKDWLVWLYPAGIRAADEQRPFRIFSGKLKLESAGADDTARYALLHGKIRLLKPEENGSAFEGNLEAVLTYHPESREVRSLRGVVEGTFLYRTRGTSRELLKVAIESRPE